MLESTESLLPKAKNPQKPLRVLMVGVNHPLEELKRLLTTLEVNIVGELSTFIKKIHPATYLPEGKLKEITALAEELEVDAVIIDEEISPKQLQNTEKVIGVATLDRPGVILEIFSKHARSKESKTQVDLAKLEYVLPRLAHLWSHFERQRGGGVGNRGMGEKQIEVDRRLVKNRMTILKDRLKQIERERITKRSSRKEVLKVALVGYTNAGKSTLLNALTKSNVLAEDKLFATLDPSVRMLSPDTHPPVVAIDTVGFVSRLPHALVASFKSTLEELKEADLIVHVVDGSSNQVEEEYEVTRQVIEDLGCEETPLICVVNKMDQVQTLGARNKLKIFARGSVMISALDRKQVALLREQILSHFVTKLELYELLIPHENSKLQALIHAHGKVESIKHLTKGAFIRVRLAEEWAKKLKVAGFRK